MGVTCTLLPTASQLLAPLSLPLPAATARTTRRPGARAWWEGREAGGTAFAYRAVLGRWRLVAGAAQAGLLSTCLFCCACRSAAAHSGSMAASTTTSR